jgi:hypothetical protein
VPNISLKSATGKTPLDYAVLNNNPVGVNALLHHGVEPWTLNPVAVPPYIPHAPVSEESLKNLFAIMDLLPTMRHLWDARWTKMREYMAKTSSSSSSSSSEKVPEPASKKPVSTADEETLCIVCMEALAETVALPCRHKVVCKACSLRLKDSDLNGKLCVLCRQPIEGIYVIPDNKMQS